MAESVEARVTPPNLSDASKYFRIPRVPILDKHTRQVHLHRNGKPVFSDDGKPVLVDTVVDEKQLEIIARNTNYMADQGDYPLVRLGHIDFDLPETEQPDQPGYLKNIVMGTFRGSPTILSDVYVERKFETRDKRILTHDQIIKGFPRRSVEIYKRLKPDAYIDSLALLTRGPERHLGLITYEKDEDLETFECSYESEKMEKEDDVSDGMNSETDAVKRLSDAIAMSLSGDAKFSDMIAEKLASHPNLIKGFADRMKDVLESVAENPDEMVPDLESQREPEPDKELAKKDKSMKTDEKKKMDDEEMEDKDKAREDKEKEDEEDEEDEDMDMEKDKKKDAEKYAALAKNYDRLLAKNGQLEAFSAQQQQTIDQMGTRLTEIEKFSAEQAERVRIANRREKLASLREQGYLVRDDAKVLERFSRRPDEDFDAYITDVTELYQPQETPIGLPRIRLSDNEPTPRIDNSGANENDPLTFEEVQSNVIEEYAAEKGIVLRKGEDPSKFGLRQIELYCKDIEGRKVYRERARKVMNARETARQRSAATGR
jgi:hypothetical protein